MNIIVKNFLDLLEEVELDVINKLTKESHSKLPLNDIETKCNLLSIKSLKGLRSYVKENLELDAVLALDNVEESISAKDLVELLVHNAYELADLYYSDTVFGDYDLAVDSCTDDFLDIFSEVI